MDTLQAAKDQIRENFDKGSSCPCCGQFVKLYKRKLTSAMAYALVEIYKENKRNDMSFFHVEKHFKKLDGLPASIRGDFAKLRYWHLIEPLKGEREDGSKRIGYYRITGGGINFLKYGLKVPSHVFLFDNKLQGKSETLTNFRESLGNKFNYDELMRGL